MKALKKATLAQRDELTSAVRSASDDLATAIDKFNTKRNELWEAVQAAVEAFNEGVADAWGDETDGVAPAQETYNEAVTALEEWCKEVAQSIEEYTANRSEKWQESEKASAYEEWKGQFEEELERCELEAPEPIEIEEMSDLECDLDPVADNVEQYPETIEA